MVLVVIAIVVARNLERSRMGRAWGAIREDETAAEMMGVNTVRTKLLAFALGASFAGAAGALQASYLGASTSDFFTFTTSILVLIMVILGGIGNIWGVLAGAIALTYIDKTLLPWIGTRVQAVAPDFPNPTQFNFLIFGILLVAMMRFRPEGFLPSRQRAAELSVHGLQEAEAEMGVEVEIDNVEIAPHGQSEVGPDSRAAEVAVRDSRRMTAETMAVGLTGQIPDDDLLVKARGGDQALRRPDRRERRRLRHPARLDRVPDRPERRGQDHVLQHDHRLLRPDRRRDLVRRPADRRR